MEVKTRDAPDSSVLTLGMLLVGGAVALVFMLKNSKLGGFIGDVATLGSKAVKTVGRVGKDIDPFNKSGKLHKAGDAVGAKLRSATNVKASAKTALKKVKKLF